MVNCNCIRSVNMKRKLIASLLICILILTSSCESLSAATPNVGESPAEFATRMEANIKPAEWTSHEGTLKDPVPIGEFGEWGNLSRKSHAQSADRLYSSIEGQLFR